MSSPEPRPRPGPPSLRALARWAIERGLASGHAPEVHPHDFPQWLREPGACFVTLRRDGALRGCTGSLEARRPLVVDLVENAWRSARADPRFPPLRSEELAGLDVHVVVLDPPEPLPVRSEAELLAALRPGVDGLTLRDGRHAATFLPAVWEGLPSPARFVEELRRKAGLPPDHWSDTLRFERYTVREVD